MSTPEYRFVTDIVNELDSSFVPDVGFHPDGTCFAVSYRDNNQIRVYDTSSLRLLQTYQNPQAKLSFPHGLLITKRHIIVSNKLKAYSTEPSKLTVYRIGDISSEPVTVFTTPLERLREAHSMHVRNGLLYVTYCGKDIGAILTYAFDDETGKITGPLNVLEDWFSRYGEPKGICVNEDGSKAFVTMAVDQIPKRDDKIWGAKDRLRKVHGWETQLSKLRRRKREINHHFNGIAVFDIDEHGILSRAPVQIFKQTKARLENIHIVRDCCVIADPLNDRVYIYDLDNKRYFDRPRQVLNDNLAFPHDACFSPDKKLLIVTNYGIEVIEGRPQWETFRQPRSDKIRIYKQAG